MSNMSYCLFENTYHDLTDCKEALENDGVIRSESEVQYALKLLNLCKEVWDLVSEDDIIQMYEKEE